MVIVSMALSSTLPPDAAEFYFLILWRMHSYCIGCQTMGGNSLADVKPWVVVIVTWPASLSASCPNCSSMRSKASDGSKKPSLGGESAFSCEDMRGIASSDFSTPAVTFCCCCGLASADGGGQSGNEHC
uniref:Secreted protein n=1 Tax=Romanomermis culicivorax TaxID=13658 RepID=A0A915KB59_ROMCU